MREGWAEAVPRKVILILDICALINSIKSLVYRQLGWVGVQKANNYNPSHIGHEAGRPPRNVYRILPGTRPEPTQLCQECVKVVYDTLYSRHCS